MDSVSSVKKIQYEVRHTDRFYNSTREPLMIHVRICEWSENFSVFIDNIHDFDVRAYLCFRQKCYEIVLSLCR